MEYIVIIPYKELEPVIHSYWKLKRDEHDNQWERNFPDGCAGLVMNLGDTCLTDNGSVSTEFGKTYTVGAMTSFKDSFIDSNTLLIGVCLKPATFTNFYNYAPQNELIDKDIAFECGYYDHSHLTKEIQRSTDFHHFNFRLSHFYKAAMVIQS